MYGIKLMFTGSFIVNKNVCKVTFRTEPTNISVLILIRVDCDY